MRYGVISDVHANLPALETALTDLHRLGVDRYVCAGDLVGYGAQPNECVDVLARLGAPCIAGNHDLIALGVLSVERCERLARESLRWTREALDPSTREYLAELPRRLELPGGVVVAHGSLDDPQEYVRRTDEARTQLDQLAQAHPEAGTLIVGHTHRPLASDGRKAWRPLHSPASVTLTSPRPWLLNPGAVGQSRESRVRARYMVLDLDRREASFRAVRYDVRRSRGVLRRHGLPTRSVHLPPWGAKAVLRPAVRVALSARTRLKR